MSDEASTIIQGYLKRMQDEYENFNTVYNDLLTKLNLAQTEYTKQDSQFKKLLTDETNLVTIYSSSTRQNFDTEFEKVQSAAQAKILNISQVPEELDEFIKLANLDLEGVRNQLNEISQNVAAIKDEANAQIDSINRELPKVTEAGQKAIEDMNKVVNQVTASGQTLQQQINELDLRLSGIVNNQSNISKDITAIQETNKAINASQEALLKLIDKTDDRIDQINQQIGDIVKIRTDIDTLKINKADKTFVTAQLAQTTNKLDTTFVNAEFPPTPLVGIKEDGDSVENLTKLQLMIDNYNNVLLPDRTYKLGGNLIIRADKRLSGASGSFKGSTKLIFDAGFGIISDGRYSTIESLTLETAVVNDGVAILFENSSGTDHHLLTFRNLFINNFKYGFKNSTGNFLWNVTFKDIRLNMVENAFKILTPSSTSFGLIFERVYTHGSKVILNLSGVSAEFNSCNFGINGLRAFSFSANCSLVFRSSNFECDSYVVGSGNIIEITSRSVEYDNCSFVIQCDSTVSAFGLFGDVESLIFNNSKYVSVGANAMTYFFNRNNASTSRLFAIRFISSSSIPRPAYFSAQSLNWIDAGNNVLPRYSSSVPTNKLIEGMTFYHPTLKIPVIWNGTNLTDFAGNNIT